MGRMLEALKSNGEITLDRDTVPAAAVAAPPEEAATDMPFIEVGGPRPAAPSRPQLEAAPLRLATLQQPLPRGAVLETAPLPRPANRVAAELIAYHQPDHTVSRQFASLFLQIVAGAESEEAPVLLLTGLTAGAGTTTTLLNLAIGGSRQDRRIAVVDANATRPAVAQRLGLGSAHGLADVLQGSVALEKAVLATAQPGLFVVPAGKQQGPWQAEALRWVLSWLRQRFDVVFVDGPAWNTPDLRELVPATDAAYLVLDATEAAQAQVRSVARGIAQLGSRLGGLIVTQ